MKEIPNEFYRGLVNAEYSEGVVLCKCEIPQGAVGAPVRHNLIGVCRRGRRSYRSPRHFAGLGNAYRNLSRLPCHNIPDGQ